MSEFIHEVLIPLGGGSILALLLAYVAYRFILPHWKIYREATSYQASEWVSHTYFCGYRVNEVYARRFFRRYRQYVDVGFCCAVSALTMIALRKNPTARIVEVTYPDKHTKRIERHRIVEFWMLGNWWIIDPCWLDNCLVRRRLYYRSCSNIQSTKVLLNYRQFWSYKISRQLAEKLSRPETSWQFFELWGAYAWCDFSDGRRTDFHPEIEELVADWHGNYPSPWIYICPDSEAIFFIPRIFREYMARPSRLRPKAHTIRKAIKVKKLYQKEYKRLLAEQEAREAVKSSTTSKGSESNVA